MAQPKRGRVAVIAGARPRATGMGFAALLLALLLFAPSPAFADGCDASMSAWARACSAPPHANVAAVRCLPGGVVFTVDIDGAPPLSIDASRTRPGAFRVVRGVGISPVGEFADWSDAPLTARQGLDHLAACIERGPPPFAPATPEVPAVARSIAASPWLLSLAALFAFAAFAPSAVRSRFRRARTAGGLAALSLATLVGRHLALGPAFFHQNGHGPMWVANALCEPSAYGPGFAEIFGWAARLDPARPEHGVFVWQAALAALQPAAAWVIAKRASSRSAFAWAAAAIVALDPLLARMSSSESYYGTYASLLLVATALASEGTRATRRLSVPFVLANVAAGLVVAQVVRVHPTGWVACALVPLIHAAAPGSIRRRTWHLALTTVIVGGTAALASRGVIASLLGGSTGGKWLPFWRASLRHTMPTAVVVAAAMAGLGVLLARGRRRRRAVLPCMAIAVVILALALANLHVGTMDWVRAAYAHMYTAALVAAASGVLARLVQTQREASRAAAALLVCALLFFGVRARRMTELPTDTLEYRAAVAWRAALPPGVTVVGLGRVAEHIVDVDVFAICQAGRIALSLDDDSAKRGLGAFPPGTVYYRSSLCSTPEGRPLCEALERSTVLAPIAIATLPARPSMLGFTYDASAVSIGIYRIMSP